MADQGAGQVQQALEQVRPALVADAQPAKAEQPRERPLDHPAVPTQPLGGVDPPASDPRGDAAGAQGTPQGRGVVRLVGVELGRALPGPPRPPARADDRRDGVDEGEQLGRVVGVGGREPDGQGNAVPVDDQVVLGAGLAAVGRVAAGQFAPLFARTLSESTLARDQSMVASSPSQLRSVS